MRYMSFSDYFDRYASDYEDEFAELVAEGEYEDTDDAFCDFMLYQFESSIGEYEDRCYDEYCDERMGL